jgi:hypothetical protein
VHSSSRLARRAARRIVNRPPPACGKRRQSRYSTRDDQPKPVASLHAETFSRSPNLPGQECPQEEKRQQPCGPQDLTTGSARNIRPPPGIPSLNIPELRNTDDTESPYGWIPASCRRRTAATRSPTSSPGCATTLGTVGRQTWPEDRQGRPIYADGFKAQAARRWCAAVNATGEFGTWDYKLAFSVPDLVQHLNGINP